MKGPETRTAFCAAQAGLPAALRHRAPHLLHWPAHAAAAAPLPAQHIPAEERRATSFGPASLPAVLALWAAHPPSHILVAYLHAPPVAASGL